MQCSFPCHLTVLAVLALLLSFPTAGDGQPPAQEPSPPFGFPFNWGDPQELLDQLLGGSAEQDQQALQQVDISLGEERQLGQRAFAAYRDQLRIRGITCSSRGADARYIQQLVAIVRPMMRHAKRYPRVRVFVASSEVADARCFPGGTIVVFRGLLDLVGSEAALVGVIGHELSHLDHGHQLTPLRRVKLAAKTFTHGADEQFSPQRFFQDGAQLMRLFARPFRPEDEAQADADGAVWAYRLGYDPREMAALFRNMNARRGGPEMPLPFLRSHPFDEQRCQSVLQRFQALTAAKQPPKLYIGRENLLRRIPRAEREFPE